MLAILFEGRVRAIIRIRVRFGVRARTRFVGIAVVTGMVRASIAFPFLVYGSAWH